jgi:hypothetical protein
MNNPRSGIISPKLKEKAINHSHHSNDSKDVQELNKNLKKTELGKSLLAHKNFMLASVVLIVTLALGLTFYFQNSQKKLQTQANLVHQYEQSALKEFREKKLEVGQLLTATEQLLVATQNFSHTGKQLLLAVTHELQNQNKTQEAFDLLNNFKGKVANDSTLGILLSLKKSTLAENLGKKTEALEILNKLIKIKGELLKDRIYFELGRLHWEAGNQLAAKENFNKIVSTYNKNDQFVKMAKYYLRQAE